MKILPYVLLMMPFSVLFAEESSTAQPKIGSLPVEKVLFLGNSITLHGPAPDIGWTGNWGMAASQQEKDYVHLLTTDIAKATQSRPDIMVKNIAKFEREYVTYDLQKELKRELEFKADIVIIAIGENAAEPKTDEQRANFKLAFKKLLELLRKKGDPVIFVRSSFWPNKTKDGIMQEVSKNMNATFIDISALGGDQSNAASSERKFDHAGVAAHPGDKGMKSIAEALFLAIIKRSGIPTKTR